MIKIESIDKSLLKDYLKGELSLKDVASELYRAGFFNYVPSEEQTKKFIHIL